MKGGDPSLAKDENWNDAFKRMGAVPEMQSEEAVLDVRGRMKRIFKSKTTAEWRNFFHSRDDCIVEKIQDHSEVLTDPQVLANDYVVPMSFDGVGESMVVGNQVQLSETPAVIKGPPPQLGGSTREVMKSLGYSDGDVDEVETHTLEIRKKFLGE